MTYFRVVSRHQIREDSRKTCPVPAQRLPLRRLSQSTGSQQWPSHLGHGRTASRCCRWTTRTTLYSAGLWCSMCPSTYPLSGSSTCREAPGKRSG